MPTTNDKPMPESSEVIKTAIEEALTTAYALGRARMKKDIEAVVPGEEVVSPKLLEDTWKKARMEFRSELLTNIDGIV